ncbi:P-loop containing nucleoside triphosphate hydrolase protein, partial [Ceratobasidium sp. AG-I]
VSVPMALAPISPTKRKTSTTDLNARRRGVKPARFSTLEISNRLVKNLKLSFTPAPWQSHLIQHIIQGYDSIFLAGTGYGKSLIFEGIAAMQPSKMVLVICPLKALEEDQVAQAREKGLKAVMLNEDNVDDSEVWADIRAQRMQLLYISPEMALTTRFSKLLASSDFSSRLSCIVIDECHMVEEWGGDFRPAYDRLADLRAFTGHMLPFVACSATLTSQTFNIIWNSLDYGRRPFWGIDDTSAESIDKSLFFFGSQSACRDAVLGLRQCLPLHLRACVHAFSSIMSAEAKSRTLAGLRSGSIRVVAATDAIGMGCNVPDIKNVVIFDLPKKPSTISQRWGRAGRDPSIEGVCLFVV